MSNNFYRVVLDLGQFLSKIGYGGEDKPREAFYTITGRLKYRGIGLEPEAQNQLFVGNKIYEKVGLYKVKHPIGKGGEITDWTDFRAIIDHVFVLLGVDPRMCQILYASNPFLSIGSHQKIAKLFLEELSCGGYYPIRNAILSMYSGGFDTGLIVDMGANNIRITPIYKSYILKHALKIIPMGGNDLDKFMSKKLSQRKIGTWSTGQQNKVRMLKEQACFASLNYDLDSQTPENFTKEYGFADSGSIEIGAERFLIPELLFQPKLNNLKSESLVSGILSAINDCDVDIRQNLLQNIYLTGGISSIPLLDTRLKLELEKELKLKQKDKNSRQIGVVASKGGVFSNWAGGATLIMISEFQKNWMTLKSYNENGLPKDILSY
ncbi:MAG: actin family protein [Promethearchaeota archaeon]